MQEAYKKFQHAKTQCLYGQKRDKSSVGQFDDGVMDICRLINENFPEYYTTSSCAGRCFFYTGIGIKSTDTFVRCRISHHRIRDPMRYFNLHTVHDDPTGGGDVIPQVYDGGKRQRQHLRRTATQQQQHQQEEAVDEVLSSDEGDNERDGDTNQQQQQQHGHNMNNNVNNNNDNNNTLPKVWWIRYEPFILHVACRSLPAAIQFMNLVRPIFKTVGITSLSSSSSSSSAHTTDHISGCPKYVVAIYGDEGLDMPLTNEFGVSMVCDDKDHEDLCIHSSSSTGSRNSSERGYSSCWLASLVNERHDRNANKIHRLVQALRTTIATRQPSNGNCRIDWDTEHVDWNEVLENDQIPMEALDTAANAMLVNINGQSIRIPRSYDVIGDVAILHTLPSLPYMNSSNSSTTTATDHNQNDTNDIDHDNNDNDIDNNSTDQVSVRQAIGEAIIQRNRNIKVVVLRSSNLDGHERAPGTNGIQILTGPADRIQRLPLITTHREYGVSCIVNLHHTFFSPRMGQERIRICEQVGQREEHVLVLFAGVCMDAFQIVARTNALSVTAIESNEYAYECAQKGHLLLERNKQCLQKNAAERLQIIHGDCLQVIPTLPLQHYHRILAPRPKEGNFDGDQPPSSDHNQDITDRVGGSGGKDFLIALLSVLQPNGGICHWYDFCADHEYPQCTRTVQFLSDVCRNEYQYNIQVIHMAHVGSIAKRQLRICVDFSVSPCSI